MAGVWLLSLAMSVMSPLAARAAQPAQSETDITGPVQAAASPQLFATMCALYAVGLDAGKTSPSADAMLDDVRSQLVEAHGPATDALRKFYRDHVLNDPAATMSRYITFALVAGPPPKFAVTLSRLDLSPDVIALDGFSQVLANFYQEAGLDLLWRRVQPGYEKQALLLREPLGRIVLTETGYLRELVRPAQGTFTVYSEPFVGGQTHFRNIGNHYAIVVDPALNPFEVMRHSFLHFLLDPLPIRYQQQIAADEPLFRMGAAAPRLPTEFRSDYLAFYTECLVLSVELKIQRLPASQLAAEIDRMEKDGFVLIRPLMGALAKFEVAEPPMSTYFPELVHSIDVNSERRRLQTVAFAPASDGQGTEAAHAGHDGQGAGNSGSEVDAALIEGERKIAAQDGPGAQAAFERVLAKQPAQPRALYGLAMASLLQGKATRARELFEQVVKGATGAGDAARVDPVALAWSHVYLGRMHDLDGDREEALADYRAALSVADAPEAARSAAQHGIEQGYQLAVPSQSPG